MSILQCFGVTSFAMLIILIIAYFVWGWTSGDNPLDLFQQIIISIIFVILNSLFLKTILVIIGGD
jgi:hypothetical protein